jgi:membrane protease YdiL (CAAX protease family)
VSARAGGVGTAAAVRSPAGAEALAWLAVPVGLLLLLSRLWLVDTGSSYAPALAAIFGALGILSLAAPVNAPAVREMGAAVPRSVALAVGAGAVGLAALASTLPGPALPIPGGTAVLLLVAGAGVAEEAFFRRLLYGRLLRWGPAVAVTVSAVAFGLMHVPLHGVAALPIDLGAGLLLSWQRWASGSWAVPAATHAFANLVVVLR